MMTAENAEHIQIADEIAANQFKALCQRASLEVLQEEGRVDATARPPCGAGG